MILIFHKIDDRGALAFKKLLTERGTKLTVLFGGNLLSESVTKAVAEWSSDVYEASPLEKTVKEPNEVDEKHMVVVCFFFIFVCFAYIHTDLKLKTLSLDIDKESCDKSSIRISE